VRNPGVPAGPAPSWVIEGPERRFKEGANRRKYSGVREAASFLPRSVPETAEALMNQDQVNGDLLQ
jgi:hypothetical protein